MSFSKQGGTVEGRLRIKLLRIKAKERKGFKGHLPEGAEARLQEQGGRLAQACYVSRNGHTQRLSIEDDGAFGYAATGKKVEGA